MTSRIRAASLVVAVGTLVAAIGPSPVGAAPEGGVWLAGDFHVHTSYSHDVCETPPTPDNCHPEDPAEPYTTGFTPGQQIALADIRGLDFVALTDHSTVAQQSDPGYTSDTVTLVNGYENSLPGHAQMLGADRLYGGASTCSQVSALAAALRADGGAFQINHPGDKGVSAGNWPSRFGGPECLVPDSIEVWNIGPWAWQPPAPAANDNDRAVRFWESFLDAGHRVAATGGSDNHWATTHAVQGVGQPTTWVYATANTQEAILDGIRAGRTTISNQPPRLGAVRLELTTSTGSAAMVGETAPRSSTFEVRAVSVSGDPAAVAGGTVRLVGRGGRTIAEKPVVTAGAAGQQVVYAAEFTLAPTDTDTWVRAEYFMPDAKADRGSVCPPATQIQTTACANRLAMVAFTSALYLS